MIGSADVVACDPLRIESHQSLRAKVDDSIDATPEHIRRLIRDIDISTHGVIQSILLPGTTNTTVFGDRCLDYTCSFTTTSGNTGQIAISFEGTAAITIGDKTLSFGKKTQPDLQKECGVLYDRVRYIYNRLCELKTLRLYAVFVYKNAISNI